MPYDIVKFNKGFKVCKSDNHNECLSNKELSLDKAVNQRRAVYRREHLGKSRSRSRSRSRSKSGGVTVYTRRGRELNYQNGKITDTRTNKVISTSGAKYTVNKPR